MENDVTVRGVITREYVDVNESDSVRSTAELMREEQASSAIVLQGENPVGIVTEWDVLGLVADGDDPGETPVSEVMSSPVESTAASTPLIDAAGIMSGEGIRNLLIRDDEGELLGVLTDRDVIAAVASLQRTGEAPRIGGTETSVAGTGVGSVEDAAERGGSGPVVEDPEREASPGAFVTQGVCEVCGALSDELWEDNGQLMCGDCREL